MRYSLTRFGALGSLVRSLSNIVPPILVGRRVGLGLSGLSWNNPSRYLTNLAADSGFQAFGSGIYAGPAITDPGYYDLATGGIKTLPPGVANASCYLRRPYPKGPETFKYVRVICNRPDATWGVLGFDSGTLSDRGTLPNGNVYYDYRYTWNSADPSQENAGGGVRVNVTAIPPGGSPLQIWAAEIDAIGGGFITDPTVAANRLHPAAMSRIGIFSELRFLDLQNTNFNYHFALPPTAATRPTGGMFTAPSFAQATAVLGSGNAALKFTAASRPDVPEACADFFNPAKTTNAPWYPVGALGNQMSVEILTPTGSSASFAWDGISYKLSITPAAGMTASQLLSAILAYRANLSNPGAVRMMIFGSFALATGSDGTGVLTAVSATQLANGWNSPTLEILSWEVMVAMCNQTNRDMYAHIPAFATEGWIRGFMSYVAANLKPGLKIKLELANEVWNSQFGVYRSVLAYGIGTDAYGVWSSTSNTTFALLAGYVDLFVKKMAIARDELSKAGRSLVGVFAWQADRSADQLPYMWNLDPAGLDAQVQETASAPYFYAKFAGVTNNVVPPATVPNDTGLMQPFAVWAGGQTWPRDRLVPFGNDLYIATPPGSDASFISDSASPPAADNSNPLYRLMTPEIYEPFGMAAVNDAISRAQRDAAFARSKGKLYRTYETGPHDQYPFRDAASANFAARFVSDLSHSPVMTRLYDAYIDGILKAGGDGSTFMQFGDAGKWTPANCWQFIDYPGAPDASAPKKNTILRVLSGAL